MLTKAGLPEDIRKILNALDEVVAEVGEDYVYPATHRDPSTGMCHYVYQDEPDCIAGRVLHKFGVSLGFLRSQENTVCNAYQFEDHLRDFGISRTALNVLRAAQLMQDGGNTWGLARRNVYDSAGVSPDDN